MRVSNPINPTSTVNEDPLHPVPLHYASIARCSTLGTIGDETVDLAGERRSERAAARTADVI